MTFTQSSRIHTPWYVISAWYPALIARPWPLRSIEETCPATCLAQRKATDLHLTAKHQPRQTRVANAKPRTSLVAVSDAEKVSPAAELMDLVLAQAQPPKVARFAEMPLFEE